MLQPDPAQQPRLCQIIDNLQAWIVEATERGWLGEVDRLQVSLAAARQKLDQVHRLGAQSSGVTMLGTPVFRPAVRQPS